MAGIIGREEISRNARKVMDRRSGSAGRRPLRADVPAAAAWHNRVFARGGGSASFPKSTIAEHPMALAIRDVCERDLDAVLALNNTAGRSILALDASQLQYFHEHADYFRVAEIDGNLAGFLIALREDGHYESPNYQWFAAHYPQFLYIDRIVIANAYRRHGLGRVFYSDVQSYAEVRVPLLACEVFLEPRDDVVVLFHGTYGFQEVGQQRMGEHGPQVSLLARDLPSYAYVRDSWLEHGGLPQVPWLAERERPQAPSSAPLRVAGEQAA
jgi:predicted GNAT superfamily acetyltransferase